MEDFLHDFVSEALDLCDEVEQHLLSLERNPASAEILNSVFRAFHTVKGGAGFLSITPIIQACHTTENLFDYLRSNKIAASTDIIEASLQANSYVADQLQRLRDGVNVADISSLPEDIRLRLETAQLGHSLDRTTPDLETPLAKKHIDWESYYAAVSGSDADGTSSNLIATKPAGANPPLAARNDANTKRDEIIKIDAGKLDAILEAADESVQATNQAASLLEELRQIKFEDASTKSIIQALDDALTGATRYSRDLQKATLSTRMQPVGRLFQRFPKLVRDLARELGKSVNFETSGVETEVDRVVVDSLYDPMVHMLRNSLDHGIETPTERATAGKSNTATIRLAARQEGSVVVIELSDDGRGMDPHKIHSIAILKGLIDGSQQLTDAEALNLVFLPGFSTKAIATSVSGRGVGMDVVRTTIEGHRGTVTINSEVSMGTTITVRLPIAISIIPTLLIRTKDALLGIPMALITRVVDLSQQADRTIGGAPTFTDQGTPLRVTSVNESLGYPEEHERCGLVMAVTPSYVLSVPFIEGVADLVIKPMTALRTEGVSGTARSASGEIVLILDTSFIWSGCRRKASIASLQGSHLWQT